MLKKLTEWIVWAAKLIGQIPKISGRYYIPQKMPKRRIVKTPAHKGRPWKPKRDSE